jgi:hypothetical protein
LTPLGVRRHVCTQALRRGQGDRPSHKARWSHRRGQLVPNDPTFVSQLSGLARRSRLRLRRASVPRLGAWSFTLLNALVRPGCLRRRSPWSRTRSTSNHRTKARCTSLIYSTIPMNAFDAADRTRPHIRWYKQFRTVPMLPNPPADLGSAGSHIKLFGRFLNLRSGKSTSNRVRLRASIEAREGKV